MPSIARSDSDCIQSAYEAAPGEIFKQLFENLTGQPDGPGDQRYVAKFTVGYNAAKHAKALALVVVGSPVPAIATEAPKKRSAPRPKPR
jgi:hypothetical protein